jgi:hypothetical protein
MSEEESNHESLYKLIEFLQLKHSSGLEKIEKTFQAQQILLEKGLTRIGKKPLVDVYKEVQRGTRQKRLYKQFENYFTVQNEIKGIKIDKIPDRGINLLGIVTEPVDKEIYISLKDSNKKDIPGITKRTKAGKIGNYSLTYTKEELEGLKNRGINKMTLVVEDKHGKPLEGFEKSIDLTEKDKGRIIRNIGKPKSESKMDKKIRTTKSEKSPVRKWKKIPRSSERYKEVKKAKIEEVRHFGPSEARALKDAGINDLESFVKTEESKLKEILHETDIPKLKDESKRILKKKGGPA